MRLLVLERSQGGLNKQKHLQSDEYINDLEEWMEHQYDPGYWTGETSLLISNT
jgi:hypothetical protein